MYKILAMFALAPFTVAAQTSYTTAFPLTANPITENGNWINGGTVGLDWCNVQTKAGAAFSTCYQAAKFNDSTAVLTGTWGQNQTASGVVYEPAPVYGNTNEVELRLNTTIKAHSITGYEFNCSLSPPGNAYMNIVRWNGPVGNFSVLKTQNSTGCAKGDILTATNVNGLLTLSKNGKVYLTVTDNTYTAGSPGIGFDNATSVAVEPEFGFSSFTASSGSTPPPPPTTYSVTLNWQNPGGNDAVVSYNIYRAANGSSTFAKIAGTTALTFTDSSVADGSVYSYYGTGVDASGKESVPSNTLNFTIPTSTASGPLPPANFTGVLN